MYAQTTKGLRTTLLVYAIYSLVYGLLHVLSPELVQAKDPAIERVLGAAFVAFALGAALSYREKDWSKNRLAVLMQAVWMILYTLTMIWGLLTGEIISMAWPPAVIGAVFAILFTVFYFRQE